MRNYKKQEKYLLISKVKGRACNESEGKNAGGPAIQSLAGWLD